MENINSNIEIILIFLKVTLFLGVALLVVYFGAKLMKIIMMDDSKSNLPYEPKGATKYFSFYGTTSSLIYSKSNSEIEYKIDGMRDGCIRAIIVCEIFAVFLLIYILMNN